MQALREADPRRIGPYEVLGRLGAGGMGEVYLAEARTGPRLAVKVVRAEHAEDRTFRARFRQEVRAAQTVGGAGTYTARVVDADTEAERPWMATEFVDGPNLRDAVLDQGALPEQAVRTLAGALGEALAAIHAKGMVHRDLKPSNILLAADGPRVIDFGIVRALEATVLTRTGTVVGSVGFVSPEQIRNGATVGPPSDVFSLGTVLAYAAAGRGPFGEGQDSVVLLRILTRDFDLSGVPADLRPLVESCLREDTEQRPTPHEVVKAAGHTARTLRESMRPGWYSPPAGSTGGGADEAARAGGEERWLPQHGSVEGESRVEYMAPVTVTDVPAPKPTPGTSRRRLLTALTGGAAVAAVGGLGGWLWLRDPGDKDGGSGGASSPPSGAAHPHKPATATVGWQYALGKDRDLSEGWGACGALSPDGSVLYLAVDDGTLRAVGTADGKERWQVRYTSKFDEYAVVTTPAVGRDGTVYVGVRANSGGEPAQLRAVTPKGKAAWSRALPGDITDTVQVAGSRVLVGYASSPPDGPGGVCAFSLSGHPAWDTGMPGAPDVAPTVAGGVVYVGNYDNHLHALRASDGSELWKLQLESDVYRPAVSGDTIAVGVNGGSAALYGISTAGRQRWRKPGRGTGIPFAPLTLGSVFIVSTGRELIATGTDGSALWKHPIGDDGGQPAVVGDLCCVRSGSEIHALDVKGRVRWKVEVGGMALDLLAPVVAGDGKRFYTASGEGVAAVDIKG